MLNASLLLNSLAGLNGKAAKAPGAIALNSMEHHLVFAAIVNKREAQLLPKKRNMVWTQ